jgi:hypothetical protein
MSGNQIKIAISGKANSGKNTVANMFINNLKHYATNSKIVGIADQMKHLILSMFPEAKSDCLFGPSELRSEIINEKYKDINGKPLTYRQALLDLGALGRKYNKNFWLNWLVADANSSKNIGIYIVSDARFINECDYLKKSNFIMIRVLRDSINKISDPSELEQDFIPNSEFDYIIYNNDSIEKLNEEIKLISAKLLI